MTTPSDDVAFPAFPGLVGIIAMVNGLDAAGDRATTDVAVTATIQGMIVSGVVISAREYMRRLGGQFAEAFAGSPIPEAGVELQERLAAVPGAGPASGGGRAAAARLSRRRDRTTLSGSRSTSYI